MIKTLTQLSQENGAYLDTTYPLASKIVFYDEANLLDVFGKYCVQCENGMSFFYKGKAQIYNVSIFVKLQPIHTPIPISVTARNTLIAAGIDPNKAEVRNILELLEPQLTASQNVNKHAQFESWYEDLFSGMADKQVWENHQIKNIANLAWQAGAQNTCK